MKKIREVLRLRLDRKASVREIASACNIGRTTVDEYLHRAAAAGLSWPLPDEMTDAFLQRQLFPPRVSKGEPPRPMPDWSVIQRRLGRKGMTLLLLWQEYRSSHPDGYGYSRYAGLYREWHSKTDVRMLQHHKAGEKMFVDWAHTQAMRIGLRNSNDSDLGRVTAVVATYSNGVAENTYAYKPYGTTLAKTGTAADPSYLWNGGSGYRRTGLSTAGQYVRRRHYNSTTCVWNTLDRYWPMQAAYAYGAGSPTIRTDPSGCDVIGVGGGGTIGATSCPQNCPCDTVSSDSADTAPFVSGWAICCHNVPKVCRPCVTLPATTETDSGLMSCSILHEQTHCDQYTSGRCQAQCLGPTITECGVVFVQQSCGECEAFLAELNCMMRFPDRDCKHDTLGIWCRATATMCEVLTNSSASPYGLLNCPPLNAAQKQWCKCKTSPTDC